MCTLQCVCNCVELLCVQGLYLHVACGRVEARKLPEHAIHSGSNPLAGDVLWAQQRCAHALLLKMLGEFGKSGRMISIAAAASGDEGGWDGGMDLLLKAGGDARVAVANGVGELRKGGGQETVQDLLCLCV